MQIKDISNLRNQIRKISNKSIDDIINQLIFNEELLKINAGNANVTIKPFNLNIKFLMDIQDSIQTKPWQIYCNPVKSLK